MARITELDALVDEVEAAVSETIERLIRNGADGVYGSVWISSTGEVDTCFGFGQQGPIEALQGGWTKVYESTSSFWSTWEESPCVVDAPADVGVDEKIDVVIEDEMDSHLRDELREAVTEHCTSVELTPESAIGLHHNDIPEEIDWTECWPIVNPKSLIVTGVYTNGDEGSYAIFDVKDGQVVGEPDEGNDVAVEMSEDYMPVHLQGGLD